MYTYKHIISHVCAAQRDIPPIAPRGVVSVGDRCKATERYVVLWSNMCATHISYVQLQARTRSLHRTLARCCICITPTIIQGTQHAALALDTFGNTLSILKWSISPPPASPVFSSPRYTNDNGGNVCIRCARNVFQICWRCEEVSDRVGIWTAKGVSCDLWCAEVNYEYKYDTATTTTTTNTIMTTKTTKRRNTYRCARGRWTNKHVCN